MIANLFKQHDCRRLRRCIELSAQQVRADLIMVQRRRAFTTMDITAHHKAVGILTIWIASEQMPEIAKRFVVVAGAVSVTS